LKHLSRTGLLLHVVDIAPMEESDPVEAIRVIERELEKYSVELAGKERWLVLNKMDLLLEDEVAEVRERILKETGWQGPVYLISAAQREGTTRLINDIAHVLERNRREAHESEEAKAPLNAALDEDFDF
jgi:GTP-binding protein